MLVDSIFGRKRTWLDSDTNKTSCGYKEIVAPAKAVDPSDKWKEITVEMWRDAVYTNQTYFGNSHLRTIKAIGTREWATGSRHRL